MKIPTVFQKPGDAYTSGRNPKYLVPRPHLVHTNQKGTDAEMFAIAEIIQPSNGSLLIIICWC